MFTYIPTPPNRPEILLFTIGVMLLILSRKK